MVVDIDGRRAEATVEAIRGVGREAVAVVADVTVEDEVVAAIAVATREFGGLDVMFNNVGIDLEFGRVPFEQSDTLDTALTRAGKPHRFVVVPNADHQFSDVKDRATLLREVEAFLGEHLPATSPNAP